MAKDEPTAMDLLQRRYDELSHNLQIYRKQYVSLQDEYPPESEYLIQQLKRVQNVLEINKSEIIEIGNKMKALREELAKTKVKRKNVFLRLVG